MLHGELEVLLFVYNPSLLQTTSLCHTAVMSCRFEARATVFFWPSSYASGNKAVASDSVLVPNFDNLRASLDSLGPLPGNQGFRKQDTCTRITLKTNSGTFCIQIRFLVQPKYLLKMLCHD